MTSNAGLSQISVSFGLIRRQADECTIWDHFPLAREPPMTQTFEAWITPLMIGGLMLFMCFIIWDLAKQSRAGRFGTLMLFVVLGAGMLGYLLKVVITWWLERGTL